MNCNDYREALSARFDGEDAGMPARALEAHLAACADCRRWVSTTHEVSRALRIHAAEEVPDLTAPILAAIAASPGARRETTPPVIRLVLAVIAGTQLLAALPAVLGNDLGATVHVAHEQGAWGIALAAGLAFCAWKPSRASALAPMLAVFVACLGLMTAVDIAAGRVAPSAEAPHLMTGLGLVMLWLESNLRVTVRA